MHRLRHMLLLQKRGMSWVVIIGLLAAGLYLLAVSLAPLALSSPPVLNKMRSQVETQLKQSVAAEDTLYIPKIGVQQLVVQGKSETALLRGAWQRKPENGNPRDGGNFVLSAHRFDMGLTPQGTIKKSPFYHIDKLGIGDEIVVDYAGKRYTYRVFRTYLVNPQQVSIEARTADPTLTLYSCTLRGSADGREVIEAKPVQN